MMLLDLSCFIACFLGVVAIYYVHHLFRLQQGVPKEHINNVDDLAISFSKLFWVFGSGPLCGMWVCLVLSVCYNYDGVTATRCSDQPADEPSLNINFIPSISACLGDNLPQAGIWRSACILQNWVRLPAAIAMYGHFEQALQGTASSLNKLLIFVAFVENVGIIILSTFSSTDSSFVHEIGFCIYAVAHATCMILTIVLTNKHIRMGTCTTTNHRQHVRFSVKAYKYRVVVAACNIASLVVAMAFFTTAQGSYCHTYGWYSMFAICEWFYVVSAQCFHYLEHIDLYYIDIHFSFTSGTVNRTGTCSTSSLEHPQISSKIM